MAVDNQRKHILSIGTAFVFSIQTSIETDLDGYSPEEGLVYRPQSQLKSVVVDIAVCVNDTK
jgi:hypothetical protein